MDVITSFVCYLLWDPCLVNPYQFGMVVGATYFGGSGVSGMGATGAKPTEWALAFGGAGVFPASRDGRCLLVKLI